MHQFRSYEEGHFEFCPSINVLCGPNAIGKTTVLEAIHLLMTGRSFKTPHLQDLIKQGCPYFAIEAVFVKHGIEQKIKIFFNKHDRHVAINHTSYRSFSHLLGNFPGVCMSPEDSSLVKGSPMIRRSFLDLQLAQSDPLYVHMLTRYHQAMRQRNCLLRSKCSETLESWEHEMANAAGYITHKRSLTCQSLNEKGEEIYSQLANDGEKLSVAYKTVAPDNHSAAQLKEYYIRQFAKLRKREYEMGYTLTGPHKDDLSLFLGSREARQFASEGQQRSFVTALKFAEWQLLKKLTEGSPLMLIDDAGMGWDSSRKRKLVQYLDFLDQVFLTTQDDSYKESKRELRIKKIIK